MTSLNDMRCVHHYIVDQQNNAECKLCGDIRVFERNPIRYNGIHGLFPIDLSVKTNQHEYVSVTLYDI